MNKTNAMRLLDGAGIPYKTLEYEADENNLAGVHVAEQIGIPVSQVFKTLVARGEKKGIMVFCIPAAEEINLKKAAAAVGDKKIEMVHVKELPGLTGYIRGGCSPVGMKKKYPVYFDESIRDQEEITISAGVRGCQLKLKARALTDYIGAEICSLT